MLKIDKIIAAAFVAFSALGVGPVAAQEWPSRPITILVGYPAGGANDLVTRALTDGLSQRLGQSVLVENRPGAAGVVAADAATRAAPDGYTLYMTSSAQALVPSLREVAFDLAAFEAIKLAASGSYFLLVRKDLEAESVKELLALAEEQPGQLTYASSGIGAGPHLTGELFKSMAGVDILHIPYAGDTPVLTDLLAGRVDMGFVAIAPSQQYVVNGDLRALAVSGSERSELFPDVPTVEEAGELKGFDMGVWWGLVAPPETPLKITAKVEAAMAQTLAEPSVRETLVSLGFVPGSMAREEFQAYLASEKEKFARIVQQANITIE